MSSANGIKNEIFCRLMLNWQTPKHTKANEKEILKNQLHSLH